MKIQDLTKMNRKAKKNHLIQKKGQNFGQQMAVSQSTLLDI